jgi:hypothetical protein
MKRTLNVALGRTYNAAQLRVRVYTRPLPLPPIKTPTSVLSTSHCIYQFTCSCGESYIGRTDRRLEMRAKEHLPKRIMLSLGSPNFTPRLINQKVTSSITRHLIETKHVADIHSSFRVITRCDRPRRLKFLEALLINRHKPVLCAQKDLRVTLRLPWFY